MAQVNPQRMAAKIDGDFVVFLIGMRVNKWWKFHQWMPVFFAMPKMLKELAQHPESGCLGTVQHLGVIIQYWRSFDHLEAFARNANQSHWPAWTAFNKRIGNSRGDVGIWHETYLVRANEYEAIYSGMPPYGLGKAGALTPASGHRDTARGRVSATA